jgi:iron complex transport system permease protein
LKNRLPVFLALSFVFMLVLAILSLNMGVYTFGETSILKILGSFFSADSSVSATDAYILGKVRLPRVVMAVLVGSILAVSGTCLQGIFKNPLATPDLIGVTAGATLMAAITIVLGGYIRSFIPEFMHFSLISVGAFIGALGAISLVYSISSGDGRTNVVVMLLAGVAISSLGFALVGFMIYLAKDDQLRDLTFWNLGSLGAATWTKNAILAVAILFSYSFLITKGKALNAMMLGEKDAEHLGIKVESIKKKTVILSALMVGTAVAFSGGIGFVGLIVPYILRLVFKSNYTIILPLAAVWGSILLLGADTISRTIVAPSELPIGILTAFMGAPVFIAILIRFKNSM